MDLFSAIIGFIVGMILSMITMEYILYKSQGFTLEADWDLNNERNLKICATEIGEITVPHDAKIVVKKGSYVPVEIFRRGLVKEAENVSLNFAVSEDKAYLFLGPIKRGVYALITSDEVLMEKLDQMFNKYWSESEKHVYTIEETVEDLEKYVGTVIKVRGKILNPDFVRYGHYARLILPNNKVLALSVSSMSVAEELLKSDLHGSFVEVEGILKSSDNVLVLEVTSIRRI